MALDMGKTNTKETQEEKRLDKEILLLSIPQLW